MIQSFKSRALDVLWHKGDASKVRADHVAKVRRILDALEDAGRPQDMRLPSFDFHRLQGKPVRYSCHINGPWCITFEWEDGDAVRVDYEQYH